MRLPHHSVIFLLLAQIPICWSCLWCKHLSLWLSVNRRKLLSDSSMLPRSKRDNTTNILPYPTRSVACICQGYASKRKLIERADLGLMEACFSHLRLRKCHIPPFSKEQFDKSKNGQKSFPLFYMRVNKRCLHSGSNQNCEFELIRKTIFCFWKVGMHL